MSWSEEFIADLVKNVIRECGLRFDVYGEDDGGPIEIDILLRNSSNISPEARCGSPPAGYLGCLLINGEFLKASQYLIRRGCVEEFCFADPGFLDSLRNHLMTLDRSKD